MKFALGKTGVAGYYTFILNGETVYSEPSKNLITDFGWDLLFTMTGGAVAVNSTQLQVGTGSTPPAVTDVALSAFLASVGGPSTGTLTSGTDANGAYAGTRVSYTFAVGAVVGNVAEVGLRLGGASLSSRSLVKDAGGNPAIIVVTAADQLTVVYELRYYRQPIDSSGTVMVAGVSTDYLCRTSTAVSGTVQSIAYYGGFRPFATDVIHYGSDSTFGAVGASVTGTQVTALSQAGVTVTTNSATGEITLTTAGIGTGSGNSTGGVFNMRLAIYANVLQLLGVYGSIKFNFTPPIPKDNTKILSYSFLFTMYRI